MIPRSLKLCQALMLAGVVSASIAAPNGASRTYIVQLASAPVASYAGGVAGLAATQVPEGQRLNVQASAAQAYRAHLSREHQAALAVLGAPVKVLHHYDVAFNGFAAVLTEAQAQKLLSSGVATAVLPDEKRDVDTISTPHFLGLDVPGGIWSRKTHGSLDKGEGVIVAVVDSGVQPENPSFFDRVDADGVPVKTGGTLAYAAPPASKWHGACITGAGFAADSCNNKLIGARVFSAGFKAAADAGAVTPFFGDFYDVPRDEDGHGTHTLSTAAGNTKAPAVAPNGDTVGAMSGIAPRAWVASYKALFGVIENGVLNGSGFNSDLVAAIDAAVADGVDVINYSISGSQTNLLDPVEMAFFNATAAGVFVAASAGNSGPANAVAHNSPWLMTVAASTHDRQMLADLGLSNGQVHTGASFNVTALPKTSMVLSSNIPAPGATSAQANLCFANSLDPVKAAGKIVVCDRGTNARVDKSAEVKRAGGVGMVLINPSFNTLVADFHAVPTVHLQVTDRASVRNYVARHGAHASSTLSADYQADHVVAPVMAAFSSRGPNLADASVMKPDITAPGVDVIAGFAYQQKTQAEHDAILAGSLVPSPLSNSLSGTSMSSPHVAGAAALLIQAHPGWTPSMIKSALMTSAGEVKRASGRPDPDRDGYGSGHLNPSVAVDPGLVYKARPADYWRFLCGASWLAASDHKCVYHGSATPTDLNLPSVAAEVPGSLTIKRSVKNVGKAPATYTASASVPGFAATVSPSSLTLGVNETADFTLTLKTVDAPMHRRAFGSLTWQDGTHTVTSPIQASPVSLLAPATLISSAASGSADFTVSYGFTAPTASQVLGLKAATQTAGGVDTGSTTCFNLTVPAGALALRAATYDADTSGKGKDDLDLVLLDAAGQVVASSGGPTATEMVSLGAPAAGTYQACVVGFAPKLGHSDFTLFTWVLSAGDAGGSLTATGLPKRVTVGDVAQVSASWSGLTAGTRYLGALGYWQGRANKTPAGVTLLAVEPGVGVLTQRASAAPSSAKLARRAD